MTRTGIQIARALTALTLLVAPAALADAPAVPPASPPDQLEMKADRVVGFAPLTVSVQGFLRDADGKPMTLTEDQVATLMVEPTAIGLRSPGSLQPVFSGGAVLLPEGAADDADPLRRTIRLGRPGRYTLRLMVEEPDGDQMISNTIEIRVM